ncbi:MAG: PAS/PAC sensor hybrid histidine kinase [uncultured bacterium]|nr:MAG: PAS/PAC sensor hybrid histidine kinase [uncultured bacterium]
MNIIENSGAEQNQNGDVTSDSELQNKIHGLHARVKEFEQQNDELRLAKGCPVIARDDLVNHLLENVLTILNEAEPFEVSVEKILIAVKQAMTCDAVGLRLKNGEDYPFFGQTGFTSDFLRKENTLLMRNKDGGICRNSDGSPSLECTCGLVLTGKYDPSDPLFSPGGSAWTNDSFTILEVPAEEDSRIHPRNVCIHQGYASIALIPLRFQNQIVGLLLLNAYEKGKFCPETIKLLEMLASHIAKAWIHRKTEMELRQSEEKYRLLINNIAAGLVVHAPDSSILFANSAAASLLGISLEQLTGKTSMDPAWHFLNDDTTTMKLCDYPVNRVIASGNGFHGQIVGINRPDLENRFWVLCTAFPVKDSNGNLEQIVITFTDITPIKQAEATLRKFEAKQRKMLENIGDVIVIIDENGINRFKSPNVEKYFGWKPEDVVGVGALDNVHPDDLAMAKNFIADLMKVPGGKGTAECRYLCKDGIYKWIEFTGMNLLHDPDICGILGNYSEITQRKVAEQDREKIQEQLIQAQKMESIGRLAGGVAHDFNNMLGVMQGYTEIALQRAGSNTALQNCLKEIDKAIHRSAELTNQLLAFARKQTVAPRVLDLNATVEGMLKVLHRLIGENITLKWMPGKDQATVKIDPLQVYQIMANLCTNARDSIETVGSITIETSHAEMESINWSESIKIPDGKYVLLQISDTGCGIDETTLVHIFEPFFTTKETGKGTGLGLATVYGIVKQNSGFIQALSEKGHGTTFKIYLPKESGEILPEEEADEAQKATKGNKTILLVEDEPGILRVTATMLEYYGYKVLPAESPIEAIEKACNYADDIHLLLTDVVMPEMNGKDLASKLREQFPGLRCLFMSGYTADVIAHHGVLDNGISFLRKPFTLKDLGITVAKTLEE